MLSVAAQQERLLRVAGCPHPADGALVMLLRSFSEGEPDLMDWGHPCAMLALAALKALAPRRLTTLPAETKAGWTRQLSARLLEAAGQARPAFPLLQRPTAGVCVLIVTVRGSIRNIVLQFSIAALDLAASYCLHSAFARGSDQRRQCCNAGSICR